MALCLYYTSLYCTRKIRSWMGLGHVRANVNPTFSSLCEPFYSVYVRTRRRRIRRRRRRCYNIVYDWRLTTAVSPTKAYQNITPDTMEPTRYLKFDLSYSSARAIVIYHSPDLLRRCSSFIHGRPSPIYYNTI